MEKKTGPLSGMAGKLVSDHGKIIEKVKAASQSRYGFKAHECKNIPFLTQKQAAQQLGVSLKTLERMRNNGIGPAWTKVGKQIRYAITALDAWISQNTISQDSAESSAAADDTAGVQQGEKLK